MITFYILKFKHISESSDKPISRSSGYGCSFSKNRMKIDYIESMCSYKNKRYNEKPYFVKIFRLKC